MRYVVFIDKQDYNGDLPLYLKYLNKYRQDYKFIIDKETDKYYTFSNCKELIASKQNMKRKTSFFTFPKDSEQLEFKFEG